MRPSWLVLSLLVHTVAVAVACGVGAYTSARVAATRPYVELQATLASAPGEASVVAPAVVVETSRFDVVPLADVQIEPPLERPVEGPVEGPTTAACVPPRDMPLAPSLQRVVPPTAAPAALPQAFVEATPRADNEPPVYPENERRLGHEGTVVIRVTVDAHGFVLAAELLSPSPHPGLNREALRAVRRWRFHPGQRHGANIASTTDQSIRFQLRDQ